MYLSLHTLYWKTLGLTSVRRFSFFMLCGLLITIFWIPGGSQERGIEGGVKTLEEWEVGRDSNTFAKTKCARLIASVYHRLAKSWDKIYLWLDTISGGEEVERRAAEREEEEEEMQEVNNVNIISTIRSED